MSEQTPMVNQPRDQSGQPIDPRIIPTATERAVTPRTGPRTENTARLAYVYFTVYGHTDAELIEDARAKIAEFSTGPYGFKIEAEAQMLNSGDVLVYEGRVTAWPETP